MVWTQAPEKKKKGKLDAQAYSDKKKKTETLLSCEIFGTHKTCNWGSPSNNPLTALRIRFLPKSLGG